MSNLNETMHRFHDEIDINEYFGIAYDQLISMFEPDNIRDLRSQKILKLNGGVNGVINALRSDQYHGISSKDPFEIERREMVFGHNQQYVKPIKSIWEMIKEVFEDTMLRIITVAAFVSISVGILKDGPQWGWADGFTIILAVVIIVAVTAGNNYMKEKQFQKLNKQSNKKDVQVTRDEQILQLPVENLLVGDILHLQLGEEIPVDGILLQGNVVVDESSITGESDALQKRPLRDCSKSITPFCVSGSKVIDGAGQMIVCVVGDKTQNGQLKLKLQEEEEPTPLQIKLENIANQIGKVGLAAAILTFLGLIINLMIQIALQKRELLSLATVQFLVNALIIAITIIVVAVPEGLPLAVTIALAYSVNKMKDENNLVRRLEACEIMGGVDNVCSDKTGTLTQNQMTVTNLFFEQQNLVDPIFYQADFSKENKNLLFEGICINSSANPVKNKSGQMQQIGNKTDCALIQLADNFGYNYQEYRPSKRIVKTIPYNSDRKKMITIYQLQNHIYRVFVKGASEMVLDNCKFIQSPFNQNEILASQRCNIQENVIKDYSNQSLRTIALAYKDIQASNPMDIPETDLSKDLSLLAITGIKDPLRKNVIESIQACREAGITVRMVTGDNLNTAIAISKEAKILHPSYDHADEAQFYYAMEGKQFREMVGGIVYDNPDEKDLQKRGEARVKNLDIFKKIKLNLKVLARSTPDDKYLLVTGLKQLDSIVAVTGDGSNDAPALKKAHVGFAMGISGTDIAKQAAGIILLDDNFSSIITSCKWGRNIFDSIRKFIQFQLTINAVALFMAFIGALVLSSSPLNSIQMLWVNLIMDTFAALALATEPPSDKLLKRPPYQKSEGIVTPIMWRNIFGQSMYQMLVLCIILFAGPTIFNIPSSANMQNWNVKKGVHYTIFFQTFVFMQIFNEINCRKLEKKEINVFKGIFNNPIFWLIEIISIVFQFLLVQFGGSFVKCSPLTIFQHSVCILLGSGSIFVGISLKFIPEKMFSSIKIFKNRKDIKELSQLDRSTTSILRRKSTSRLINKGSINPGSVQSSNNKKSGNSKTLI